MREILRSCIGLSVAIALLSKALTDSKPYEEGKNWKEILKVQIEREKYHPAFPVPKITVIKR
jgi:N-alpha-acetyltransferase 35, NatC auxiliary subunit